MANEITVLTEKRRWLGDQKAQLKRDYERKVGEIDAEINHINDVLKTIKEAAAQYACKACGGTGIRNTIDAAGSRDKVPCKHCHGTGFDASK